jgi:superfamily I DNA/RNA helicase
LIFTAQGTSTLAPPRPGRIRSGSVQQEAFWEALTDGRSHIRLEARAGSGKSSSCREGIHRLGRDGGRVVYAAFNKHIAQEFQAGLPDGAFASTMHSLGFAAIREAYGDVAINNDKMEDLAERYFPRRSEDRENRYAASRLAGLCKGYLLDGTDEGALRQLAIRHDVDLDTTEEDVLAVVPEILQEAQQITASIDFDDMIWLPVVNALHPTPADHLFLDEAQDLNICQHDLAVRLCPSGRTIFVGDTRQAIYAFRGADSESMDTLGRFLRGTARGLTTLPLTVTWRSPWSHVALARNIVPDLEAAPNAAEGTVEELEEGEAFRSMEAGDMVLCRTNAPLVSGCFRLLKEGKRAVVRGRDIGKGLLALIARLRAKTIKELFGKLDSYRVKEEAKLVQLRNPGAMLIALHDKVECLKVLADGCHSIDALRRRIDDLFSNESESGAVIFSTVHKAKGLERDTIFVLAPNQLPHPMAKTAEAQLQELNLAYVAATRSKDRLVFVGSIPSCLSGK